MFEFPLWFIIEYQKSSVCRVNIVFMNFRVNIVFMNFGSWLSGPALRYRSAQRILWSDDR